MLTVLTLIDLETLQKHSTSPFLREVVKTTLDANKIIQAVNFICNDDAYEYLGTDLTNYAFDTTFEDFLAPLIWEWYRDNLSNDERDMINKAIDKIKENRS